MSEQDPQDKKRRRLRTFQLSLIGFLAYLALESFLSPAHQPLTFLARTRHDETRAALPRFVERELLRFLECGVLAHGFARVHCSSCGQDALVAFSCKGRGFCPSCGGRRMAQTAAHLTDRVLPAVGVRQWVLTFPHRIRFLLAYDPALCRLVRGIFLRALFGWLRRRARHRGIVDGRCGAVNFVQRFGGALNLNLHFHALVLDGVYTAASPFSPRPSSTSSTHPPTRTSPG